MVAFFQGVHGAAPRIGNADNVPDRRENSVHDTHFSKAYEGAFRAMALIRVNAGVRLRHNLSFAPCRAEHTGHFWPKASRVGLVQ